MTALGNRRPLISDHRRRQRALGHTQLVRADEARREAQWLFLKAVDQLFPQMFQELKDVENDDALEKWAARYHLAGASSPAWRDPNTGEQPDGWILSFAWWERDAQNWARGEGEAPLEHQYSARLVPPPLSATPPPIYDPRMMTREAHAAAYRSYVRAQDQAARGTGYQPRARKDPRHFEWTARVKFGRENCTCTDIWRNDPTLHGPSANVVRLAVQRLARLIVVALPILK